MATAEDVEAAPSEGPAKKKSKLPLIIGAVVGLLAVAGAGLYFTGMLDSVLGKKAAVVAAAPPPPKPAAPVRPANPVTDITPPKPQ